ncbi:MAG TPA: UpxY family transcription antiterminator [Flavipsychrobacter sp.]|nr:UpxY family transcription antiterminator [Flavipsychrobacter sp.]
MPWYVLYTKPRNEKKTAKLLEDKGVEIYCPMREVVKQWSDRKKKIWEPVFRSYVFVRLDNYEREQIEVLETPGAVRFLWWLKKPAVVREEEIQAIKNFLNDYRGASLSVTIMEGEEVIVGEGPLKDQRGKITKIKGNKAILQVRSLGWNIMAELPLQALKKP